MSREAQVEILLTTKKHFLSTPLNLNLSFGDEVESFPYKLASGSSNLLTWTLNLNFERDRETSFHAGQPYGKPPTLPLQLSQVYNLVIFGQVGKLQVRVVKLEEVRGKFEAWFLKSKLKKEVQKVFFSWRRTFVPTQTPLPRILSVICSRVCKKSKVRRR